MTTVRSCAGGPGRDGAARLVPHQTSGSYIYRTPPGFSFLAGAAS